MPDFKTGCGQDDLASAGNAKETVVTNVTGNPITKMTNKGHNRRSGVSFDTGVYEGKDTRYKSIRDQILTGKLRPSTSQLRKHWQCNYSTASAYLAAMEKEGYLTKDDTNQYSLKGIN